MKNPDLDLIPYRRTGWSTCIAVSAREKKPAAKCSLPRLANIEFRDNVDENANYESFQSS